MKPAVAITIVTFNSARYIASCLTHALQQQYEPLDIVVVDNASSDATPEILWGFAHVERLRIFYNQENIGFAGGQNQAMAAAGEADWILTLNPDVRLLPEFVARLVSAGESRATIGSVCGKLLAASPEWTIANPPLLDSTGVYFTPNLRHLDRGNGVADRGQYDQAAYVIGGTGAACLYRREMIRDISIFGEFFDNDFFAYREDADVAWRAQLLGWQCLYTPDAVAWHVRTVTPEKRRSLSPILNRHSVKNRWLLRIKNTTGSLYRHFWLPVTVRDLVVIGGCLLVEWRSLPAFWQVWKLWPRTWAKRREIMRRRRSGAIPLENWFSYHPVTFPLGSEDQRAT